MNIQLDITNLQQKIAYERDEQAYKQLFMFFYKDLYGFAHSLTRSPESTEEIVSDVMMKLWSMKDRLAEINHLRVYLFTAIRNASLNYLSQHRNYTSWDLDHLEPEHNIALYNPEEILLQDELRQQIALVIKSLSPKCQMAYKLVREEGFSYKEVSHIMGISENTVDRHLNIAFHKLSELVRHYLHSGR
ncbi:MAG TPA: RNA polymerase sigma-70 factor [Chitinophagaceae bacterium]|jgi:RNA polymerase sigma-70 factor (ECF subfamily)